MKLERIWTNGGTMAEPYVCGICLWIGDRPIKLTWAKSRKLDASFYEELAKNVERLHNVS